MFESTVRNYGVTNTTIKEFIYTWKINNFKYLHPGIGGYIEFMDDSKQEKESENLIENITLYPNGYDLEHEKFISIVISFNGSLDFINDIDCPWNHVLIAYIIDENDKEIQIFRKIFDFPEDDVDLIIESFQENSFVLEDKSHGWLPNNNLTIKIKFYITLEQPQTVHVILPPIYSKPLCKPKFEGFENMMNNEKFSDLKITVDGDKVFHVHKGILAARSPVFEAMFDHDMKENIDNALQVTDVSYKVMQEMLRFIYAGKVNDIDDIAGDMFVAADKYDLEELKSMCEQILIKNLKVENVIVALTLAENYRAPTLKKYALDFFKEHAKKIVEDDKYKAYVSEISPLLLDMFKFLTL